MSKSALHRLSSCGEATALCNFGNHAFSLNARLLWLWLQDFAVKICLLHYPEFCTRNTAGTTERCYRPLHTPIVSHSNAPLRIGLPSPHIGFLRTVGSSNTARQPVRWLQAISASRLEGSATGCGASWSVAIPFPPSTGHVSLTSV